MVYLFGVVGLILGFLMGLGVINFFLRGKSKEELQTDKALWWRYGLTVWMIAGAGCWFAVRLYGVYF